MNLADEELIRELAERLAQRRNAFSDLNVVSRKLMGMNQRLEESESLKSGFLSNIRNEINNPLSVVIGLAGQLVAIGQGGEVSALAAMICSEAHALDFQLRNIFAAAELEAGEVDPCVVRVNVTAVLSDVVDSFQHGAARKSVIIELLLPESDEPLLFSTDAEKLQVIVSNLLTNAVEFSLEGGVVTVAGRMDCDGQLIVTVQDCGMGIDLKDQDRIFDRFIQLETGTTRSHPGHGLGLSITRALTDLLQGTLTVESALGKGALFTVTLPKLSLSDEEGVFAEGGNLFLFDEECEK